MRSLHCHCLLEAPLPAYLCPLHARHWSRGACFHDVPNTEIFKINNSVWLVGLHGRQCLRSSSAGDEPFGMDTRPKYPAAASIRW